MSKKKEYGRSNRVADDLGVDAEAIQAVMRDKDRMMAAPVEFEFDGTRLKMVHTPASDAGCVVARTQVKDVVLAVEAFLRGTVAEMLEKLEVTSWIEMHLEPAMERAIRNALENGWQSGKETRSLAKIIEHQVRALAAGKIADEYRVDVQVRLVKR